MSLPQLTIKILVLAYIVAKRQLGHNRAAARTAFNQTYDFIVVGGGGSGCVVAGRLAENSSVNVLLLEAGGPQSALYTDIYWGPTFIEEYRPDLHWHYYDDPNPRAGGHYPERRILQHTGHMLGGSTAHNGMAFNRGNRRAYNLWQDRYGAQGWTYQTVMPFFLRSENNTDRKLVERYPQYYGVGGPATITSQTYKPKLFEVLNQAYNDLGYQLTDFNGPNQTGTSFIQRYLRPNGVRVSSASAYVDPNPHPNNLHVVTRSLVIKVIFNETKAVGVTFTRNDTAYTIYARKEVILSAGTYGTPQLLMLSGVGLRDHLQDYGIPVVTELPVGNNLQNHPAMGIQINISNPDYYADPREMNLGELYQYFINGTGPLANPAQFLILYQTRNNNNINFPNALNFNMFSSDGTTLNTAVSLALIRSRGTVRLQSDSPYILPRINTNYYSDSRDFDDILDALRFTLYLYETPRFGISSLVTLPTFASMGCPSCASRYMYQCDEGMRCMVNYTTGSYNHPTGTCRMGAVGRNDVVVDSHLRVKNLRNLRVCDASIIPEVPNGNTMATVLMIGERCAQFIKDTYRLG